MSSVAMHVYVFEEQEKNAALTGKSHSSCLVGEKCVYSAKFVNGDSVLTSKDLVEALPTMTFLCVLDCL